MAEIISAATIQSVRDAAQALRRAKRLGAPERRTLLDALAAAQAELSAVMTTDYPDLLQWRVPAPGRHRWDDAADGWRAWRSAGQLAAAAEHWLDTGPRYAAARASEAYGLDATLRGTNDPTLALRSHGFS